MKRITTVFCIVFLSLIVLNGCSNSKELIGKWEEQTEEKTAKGEAIFRGYEFNEDGTFKVYSGGGEILNIMDYTWTENGRNSFTGDGDGGKFPMKYLFEEDMMYLDYEQNMINNNDLKERGKQFRKVEDFSFSDVIRRDSLLSNMTAEEVANALKNEGLLIEEILVYTEENDTWHLIGRPNQYISKVAFSDTNVEQSTYVGATPNGGAIKVFETIADANYNFSGGALYTYKAGNVVLSLATEILPDEALKYKEAFYKVVQ